MGDDFYNLIETQLLLTLQSDPTIGTSGTLVQTIEAKLREDVRSYLDHELPAISVKVRNKKQIRDSLDYFTKFYTYVCNIIYRGGDLNAGINTTRQILSGLENVLEAQYQSGSDLSGLGTYSLIKGGPILRLGNSDMGFRSEPTRGFWEIVGVNNGEIEIITG